MSQRTSGFERQTGDQYMTPEWVAKTLLSVMPMYGEVWEPSCGEGSISNTIKTLDCYVRVVATDICAKYSDDGLSWDFADPHRCADHPQPVQQDSGVFVWHSPLRSRVSRDGLADDGVEWVLDNKYPHLHQIAAWIEKSVIVFGAMEAALTPLMEDIERLHAGREGVQPAQCGPSAIRAAY